MTDPGVSIRTLFRNDAIEVVRWQCCAGESGGTAEMRRSWYVVSFTHSGTFVLHTRGQSEIIDATRAMVLRPGDPFRMTRCNDSTAQGSAVVIRPDVFESIADVGDDDAIARFGVPASAFLLQHLLLRSADDPGIEETALWIASATLHATSDAPRRARATAADAIVDVQTMLAAKFTEPLYLEDIARAVHRSPYHLCRTFHRDTGLNMQRYLQRLRICASVGDVIDRRTNLSTLAQALGYSSHSHFDGAFRRELNLTPAALRRIAELPGLVEMKDALTAGE